MLLPIHKFRVESVKWFESNRPEHYAFVQEMDSYSAKGAKHFIISAGVKVGKLQLILIQARRSESTPMKTKHVFLSNFKRKDCKPQGAKLNAYGVETFFAGDMKKSVSFIKGVIKSGVSVVAHVDESDYGTGENQKMSEVFSAIREIKDGVSLRLYSASNQEAIYSEFASECQLLVMPDPISFYGPDDYIDDGLIQEAEPFWDEKNKSLTKQGKHLVKEWAKSDKKFSVLRIVSSRGKDKNAVTYKKLENGQSFWNVLHCNGIRPVFIDADRPLYWGKSEERMVGDPMSWEEFAQVPASKEKILFVVNQTCVRSTEVGFHPMIHFWHDHRNTAAYNTVMQAQLRVVHYPYTANEYWPDPSVKINVYGCYASFLFAAGRIDAEKFILDSGRKVAQRVSNPTNHLSKKPEHLRCLVFNSEAEIYAASQKEGFATPKKFWYKDSITGFYMSYFRKKIQKLTQEQADKEILFGLEKGKADHRSIAYYTPEDKVQFRMIIHDGVTDKATPKATRSIFNKS